MMHAMTMPLGMHASQMIPSGVASSGVASTSAISAMGLDDAAQHVGGKWLVDTTPKRSGKASGGGSGGASGGGGGTSGRRKPPPTRRWTKDEDKSLKELVTTLTGQGVKEDDIWIRCSGALL